MIATIHPRSKAEIDREIELLKQTAQRIFNTPKSRRAFLIKHGFITKSGKLTKQYGG